VKICPKLTYSVVKSNRHNFYPIIGNRGNCNKTAINVKKNYTVYKSLTATRPTSHN